MPSHAAKKTDPDVRRILDTLQKDYTRRHPKALVEAYRQNPVSIRIRIVDPEFASLDRAEREKSVWPILDTLPENIRSDISLLLLLTPDERANSFASHEFDHPIPSRL